MKRKKLIILIVMIIAAIIVIPNCILHSWVIWHVMQSKKEIDAKRYSFLYETDHKELLRVCRDILEKAQKGQYEYGEYNFSPGAQCPRCKDFPEVILKLEPVYIIISPTHIEVALWGGMYHVGFYAFSEGIQEEYMGDKELIEGLWFYDDGYRKRDGFEDYIESLRPSPEKLKEDR